MSSLFQIGDRVGCRVCTKFFICIRHHDTNNDSMCSVHV